MQSISIFREQFRATLLTVDKHDHIRYHDLDSLHAICDRIAVLADKKVLVTGTMDEMLKVDHPWVREYFHGPRARAAMATA